MCYNNTNICEGVNFMSKKTSKKSSNVKTIVKNDNTIEVEMKSPSKSKFGRVIIWILVVGMAAFTLVSLVWLIAANWSKLF